MYIGLSDVKYTSLDNAAINRMALCGSVPGGDGEVDGKKDFDCQFEAVGTYIYFYVIGGGDALLGLIEVEVFGGLFDYSVQLINIC